MATGNHKVEIVVGVRDLASSALNNIQRQVSGMSRTINSSGSAFGAFSRGLDGSIRKLDAMATSMYRFNMYTSNLQRNMRNIGALSAIAVGGLAVNSANKAMDFSLETAKMQGRMGVSADVRKQLEDYILKELNMEVMFSPTQIAEMGVLLGQSGVNNLSDMKTMLKTTTYFSEAVDAVPTEAAEMIIAAAKGFKISMEDSASITDKLTTAVHKSLLRVEEMPHALGQLSGRANMYGQSLDSSLVALMTARDQGMGAAQASQNLLHGLRQASMIGNEIAVMPRRKRYYEALGVDDSFFDMDKKQMKEYHEIIASLEKTMINKGFVNHKYKDQVKNLDQYQEFLKKQGGAAPDDFWDSKEAMPLIARIFGASGMTPFMMGLQSSYEEIDHETGEKTGKVYYGSAAAKKRYEDVLNSDGAVDKAHGIMESEAKFQMGVLKGAWEATQIKFMDNMLPGIKGTAELLTGWLMGHKEPQPVHDPTKPYRINEAQPLTKLQKFEGVYGEVAENFRKAGNEMTADIIKGIGDGLVAGIQIGGIMGPLRDQVGDAFGNLFTAEWGSSLWTLPWHVIDNGVNFITDVGKANTSLSDAISKLPENLQDPAELITKIAQGGLILLATGAIVGVVRLAIQGLSVALKGAKLAGDLTKAIVDWVTGSVKDTNTGPGLPDITKVINANVVNVYGQNVNGMGGSGVGGVGDSDSPGGPAVWYDHNGDPQPYPSEKEKMEKEKAEKEKAEKERKEKEKKDKKGSKALKAAKGLMYLALIPQTIDIGKGLGEDMMDFIDASHNREIPWMEDFKDMIPGVDPDGKILKELRRQEEMRNFRIADDSKTEMKAYEPKKYKPLFDNSIPGGSDYYQSQNPSTNMFDYYPTINNVIENEIKVEPVVENKFTPVVENKFDPIIENKFDPIFNPIFSPTYEVPKSIFHNFTEERKQLLNMLPREEADMVRKATVENFKGVNNAITSGFSTANERLQNLRVDNALNIQFNPNISISGNIKEYFNPTVTTTNNKATFNQPSAKATASNRGAILEGKRYGPQLLQ